MKSKLICLIIITALLGVFVSIFTFGIVASAEDAYVIEAGTYRFVDDVPIPSDDIRLNLPLSVSLNLLTASAPVDITASCSRIFMLYTIDDFWNMGYTVESSEPSFPGVEFPVNYNIYSSSSGWSSNFDDTVKSFTVLSNTSTDPVSWSWFNSATELISSSSISVVSGYYALREPLINLDASWIGVSGQSVYYEVPCSVVNGFNNYVECEGFGFEYIGDGSSYETLYYVNIGGLRYDWFALTSSLNSDNVYETSLQLLGIEDDLTGTKIYFPNSFEMDEQGHLQMFSAFEPSEAPYYEGNVFVDLMQYVVEALDVKVFGYFSPLDVVKGIAGLMLGLWLLKLLAGG